MGCFRWVSGVGVILRSGIWKAMNLLYLIFGMKKKTFFNLEFLGHLVLGFCFVSIGDYWFIIGEILFILW